EMRGHGDLRAIRHDRFRVLGEFLDVAVDVVPAAAIEAAHMVLQLVDDLVHLEGGHDGLDEDGGADRTLRHAELGLRVDEDIVPEARLEVALELWQIEIGAAAALQQLLGVVEKEQPEIERRTPSIRFICPSIRLSQVGVLASSKSAM